MGLIGEISQIRDQWSSARTRERIVFLIILFLAALTLIFGSIAVTNQVILIFTGRNIIAETRILTESAMIFLSNFDVILILAEFILLVILAVVFVNVLDKLAAERKKSKNYHEKVKIKFAELVDFMNGDRHYVTGEIKAKYNQKSIEDNMERLPIEWRDKTKEVYREITKD
jgi:hypothetical protein